jgi:hypothetical protein
VAATHTLKQVERVLKTAARLLQVYVDSGVLTDTHLRSILDGVDLSQQKLHQNDGVKETTETIAEENE